MKCSGTAQEHLGKRNQHTGHCGCIKVDMDKVTILKGFISETTNPGERGAHRFLLLRFLAVRTPSMQSMPSIKIPNYCGPLCTGNSRISQVTNSHRVGISDEGQFQSVVAALAAYKSSAGTAVVTSTAAGKGCRTKLASGLLNPGCAVG